jgi:hypothetical protein
MNPFSEVVCSRLPPSAPIFLDFLSVAVDVDAGVIAEVHTGIMPALDIVVVVAAVVEEDITHHIRVIRSSMYTTMGYQ